MPMTFFIVLHIVSKEAAETLLQARSTCQDTRKGDQISWLCDVPVEEPVYLAMSAVASFCMPASARFSIMRVSECRATISEWPAVPGYSKPIRVAIG